MSTATLAIVIPIYNEQAVLPQLLQRLRAVCNSLEQIDWRVIFVNDGRRDRSLETGRGTLSSLSRTTQFPTS